MSTDLMQKKAGEVSQLLERAKDQIAKALPAHLTPDRMVRIAMTEMRRTPALLQCSQASLLGAVIQAAQLGLEIGHALGHCYLVPFKGEVQFIVGYRGMMELARRAKANLMARAAYEGDEFDFEFGLDPKLTHKPAKDRAQDPTKLTHVYAVLKFPNGDQEFDVMSKAEVDQIRGRSAAGRSGPWVTDYEAMAKKTVIRRLFKYAPVSIEIQQAVGLDELADAGESQGNGSIIETTGKPVSDKGANIAAKVGIGTIEKEPEMPYDQQQDLPPSEDPMDFANAPGGAAGIIKPIKGYRIE
jgi:recombination protein RecT